MKLSELKCKKTNINIDEYLEFYKKIKNELEDKEFLGSFTKIEIDKLIKLGSKLFIYKKDNQIVCSFFYIPSSKESIKKFKLKYNYEEVGECGPILVDPKYRGNNLQYQMLQELTKYCKKIGKKYIITTIHPNNIISINNFIKDKYIFINKCKFNRGNRNIYIKELNKRIVFLEGLPGIGKTTIINKLNEYGINTVEEIINNPINEEDFLENDILKIKKYNQGLIVIDRGLISTLSYSQVKKIVNIDYNLNKCIRWFNKNKKILEESTIIYLTNKGFEYYISVNDINNPYGSEENQKMLETISIYNAKKYCKNVKIIEYHKDNMEKIINEIIN